VLTVKTGIRSIIPRDAWKIWGLIGLGCLLWLAVLSVGVYADAAGTAWRGILGLEAGHTARWFGATCLLAAAQLSFLILWHRSLSRKDFWGRFRLWYWTGLTWLAFCAAEATTLHVVAAQWLEAHYRLKVWNGATVCWMLVAAPIAIGLMRLLRREMHLCRPSSFLLRCSAGAAAVSAVMTLTGPLLPQTSLTALIAAGSTTLWQLLLACSTLMHTRFVIHITNEVAPKMRTRSRPSRLARIAWSAGMATLKGALWIPWQMIELTPASRLWRRRGSPATAARSAKPQKRGRPSVSLEADPPENAGTRRSVWIRGLGAAWAGLGSMHRGWKSWRERRAVRNAEWAAQREAIAAERQAKAEADLRARRLAEEVRRADADAKAEARRLADEERAAEKSQRDAAKAKAEDERRRGAEKAKAEREAVDRERAAAQARERTQREGALAAARKPEQEAAPAKTAPRDPVDRAASAAKAEIPRPKATFERSAPQSTAIKPQHVSYSEDDESEEGEGDDSRGLSRKERKRLKKMARNRE